MPIETGFGGRAGCPAPRTASGFAPLYRKPAPGSELSPAGTHKLTVAEAETDSPNRQKSVNAAV
ncbi:MAG: hypothetical protein EOO60_04445 [Hymenobacter sp.]|nr:MAG: hypothetical protein EOO60_04445 [Hymenobacter sp.]